MLSDVETEQDPEDIYDIPVDLNKLQRKSMNFTVFNIQEEFANLGKHWCHSGIFIVNFEQISNFTPCASVLIVNFEHVISGWVLLIKSFMYDVYFSFKSF